MGEQRRPSSGARQGRRTGRRRQGSPPRGGRKGLQAGLEPSPSSRWLLLHLFIFGRWVWSHKKRQPDLPFTTHPSSSSCMQLSGPEQSTALHTLYICTSQTRTQSARRVPSSRPPKTRRLVPPPLTAAASRQSATEQAALSPPPASARLRAPLARGLARHGGVHRAHQPC